MHLDLDFDVVRMTTRAATAADHRPIFVIVAVTAAAAADAAATAAAARLFKRQHRVHPRGKQAALQRAEARVPRAADEQRRRERDRTGEFEHGRVHVGPEAVGAHPVRDSGSGSCRGSERSRWWHGLRPRLRSRV